MSTKISLTKVKAVHEDIRIAVAAVFEKHGYKTAKTKCNYSDLTLKFSIEGIVNSPSAEADLAREKFNYDFKLYGIDFGTVLTDRNKTRTFTVHGFTRTGKLEARDKRDGKIYTGKPEIFYLNGEKLLTSWEKKDEEAKKAAPVPAAAK